MNQATTAPDSRELDGLLFALLVLSIIAGIAMRLFGSASFDIMGDGQITFSDALTSPGQRGLFSLYYYLTRWSIEVFGHDPLGARLPAVVFGVVTLPVYFYAMRGPFGAATAAFATIVLAFSGQHVEETQFARYYSGVILFTTLHFALFLRFLRNGSLPVLAGAVVAGVIATALHFVTIAALLPAGVVAVIGGFFRPTLVPSAEARRLLRILVWVGVAGVLVMSPVIFGIYQAWGGNPTWDTHSWALLPLLAFNHYTLPGFVAVLAGLALLIRVGPEPEAVYTALAIGTAIFMIVVVGMIGNMSPQYVLSLSPMFFICIGVVCEAIYRHVGQAVRPVSVGRVLGLTPAALVLAGMLPSLASYFLERMNISQTRAMELVAEHAAPGDILDGNVGSPFVNLGQVKVEPFATRPTNDDFDWNGYLARYLNQPTTVWLVYDVPRSGLAPRLEHWLEKNAELVAVQTANRIDRRARTLTIWRRRPVTATTRETDARPAPPAIH